MKLNFNMVDEKEFYTEAKKLIHKVIHDEAEEMVREIVEHKIAFRLDGHYGSQKMDKIIKEESAKIIKPLIKVDSLIKNFIEDYLTKHLEEYVSKNFDKIQEKVIDKFTKNLSITLGKGL